LQTSIFRYRLNHIAIPIKAAANIAAAAADDDDDDHRLATPKMEKSGQVQRYTPDASGN